MSHDIDPSLQQRIEVELSGLVAPTFSARRRGGGGLARAAAVIGTAALIVVGGVLLNDVRSRMTVATDKGGFVNGVCRATPTTRISAGGEFWPGYYDLVIGGAFAGTPRPNFGPGDYWFVRADRPSAPLIHLRFERLDITPIQPLMVTALAYPLAPGFDQAWAAAVYYRSMVDAPDSLATGCWRVSWIEGTVSDSVVYQTRTVQPVR